MKNNKPLKTRTQNRYSLVDISVSSGCSGKQRKSCESAGYCKKAEKWNLTRLFTPEQCLEGCSRYRIEITKEEKINQSKDNKKKPAKPRAKKLSGAKKKKPRKKKKKSDSLSDAKSLMPGGPHSGHFIE